MSARLISEPAPLGSIVRYSDGTPRSPARHRNKLATWESHNSSRRLVRKQAERRLDNTALQVCITLHEGDYGSNGIVAIRSHRTSSVNSDPAFSIAERPAIGSIRVLNRSGDDAELVYLASHRAEAEEWLTRHGYAEAVLDEMMADTVAMGPAKGRVAA